jgi:hypothetical protein
VDNHEDDAPYRLSGLVYPPALPIRSGIDSRKDVLRAILGALDPRTSVRQVLRPEIPQTEAGVAEDARDLPVNWKLEPEGIGISLSGGGIRSASYCLGVLQEMGRHGMLHGPNTDPHRAKYLSAVSGGSYIATALAMVTSGHLPTAKRRDRSIDPDLDAPKCGPDMRPFATGTPEESLLRDRILYLTHGPGGIPGVVWRAFLGIALNLAIFTVALATVALPLGWLYGWIWPGLRSGCTVNCSVSLYFATPTNLWWAVIAAAGASVLSGFVWMGMRFKHLQSSAIFGVISGIFLVGAVLVLAFGVGIPHLIHLAIPKTTRSTLTSSAMSAQSTTRKSVIGIVSAGAAGLVLTWIETARQLLATPSSVEKGAAKALAGFAERHRTLAINVVATIAGPVLVLVTIVLLAYAGALFPAGRSGSNGRTEFIVWMVSVAFIAFIAWQADVTAWSLNPFYRRRLSAAFVVGRTLATDRPSPTTVLGEDAAERPYSYPYLLTDCQPKGFPQLLICAAANISDYGATPSGSHVTSFVFSGEQIGGPLVGAVSTSDYQGRTKASSRSTFTTLPTAMAISGAALAPSMGRMTRAPFRFFMALANIRLGVWVPNPRRLPKFGSALHQPRPGPQYLVREMLGRNHLDAPFLYVSDGGHYENLGLVELLRRKCKVIWCIDASGDQIGTFDTFGGALRIAGAELGVSIAIDPEGDMAPEEGQEDPQYVKAPYSKGTITYADDTQASIVIVKAGVPKDAPWSIRSFQAQNPKFPCDPTLDQLYNAERFDAYRMLGAFSMAQALNAFGIDQSGTPAAL